MPDKNKEKDIKRQIWFFHEKYNKFPIAMFDDLEFAKGHIKENRLKGTLTAQLINESIYSELKHLGRFLSKRED